jgi:hypothetical protein
MRCFYGDGSALPLATVEHKLEIFDEVEAIHARLTLDPKFVDNTYGANSVGWEDSKKGTHNFKDLVGSDRAQLLFDDGSGNRVFDLMIDYISQSGSGYESLGVQGGDGEINAGDVSDVLATSTSLHRNFNERGYDSYTVDSPPTDDKYTPSSEAPEWDYRVIYEAWVAKASFGSSGFGEASVEYIHASPSKSDNTIVVWPEPCPPEWEPPPCDGPEDCPPPCDGDDPETCPPNPPECEIDPDCPNGELCEDGTCVPPECEIDTDCPNGEDCDGGVCVPPCDGSDPETCPPNPPECEVNADCPGGELCSGGTCVPVIN